VSGQDTPATPTAASPAPSPAPAPQPVVPPPGTPVRDITNGLVGVVKAVVDGLVVLLPVRGDEIWRADPASLRRLSRREELSARVVLANARRSWGR
jgi:hypothetical protein